MELVMRLTRKIIALRRAARARRRPLGRTRRDVGSAGYSLPELILAVALGAIAIAIAVPAINSKPLNLPADIQDLSQNLQLTHEWAIDRTVHYRLRAFSSAPYQYAIEQGQLVGVTWTNWTARRTVALRSNVAFSAGTLGLIAEFDERGGLVTLPAPTFTLQDTVRGCPSKCWTKTVTVNANGMVDTP